MRRVEGERDAAIASLEAAQKDGMSHVLRLAEESSKVRRSNVMDGNTNAVYLARDHIQCDHILMWRLSN